ncbi:anaphase-promoting complex subunit 7 [Ceratitis capitata]|uniref:Anaphase-promoting complex subunit 7 n=1 Tax=Ceratitis capitata TaxID=7213 RepID=W8C6A9_CERCA|nr:anaphase-promoting complex subunit 7 [Ceratitis capitata]
MESVLFANIKKLYANELYSCVIPTASLLSTLLQNDRNVATPEIEYQVLLFSGNAHYYERNYRLASKQYEAALLMRKTMLRFKNTHLVSIEITHEQFSELETRYRLAKCYQELGEDHKAISTLHALPLKSRTPKVNMLLAKLWHYGQSVDKAEAIAAYKEVLGDCPMALSAIEALLMLDVDGIEVNTLVMNASNVPKHIDWLSNWIKGHAQLYSREHLEASKTFQAINDNTKFHQNSHLLALIGKSHYYYGRYIQAQQYLETALMVNPHNTEALMPLAVVYEYNQKLTELEKLSAQMGNIKDLNSEHWFVVAECCYAAGQIEKAISFAKKAIELDERNIEAQLLRGRICLQLKQRVEAISYFRTAQCIASYRFEVYKGLYHCYVGMKRRDEAQAMCAVAVRCFRNSPRSYVMFARVLLQSNNPLAKKSAKKFLAKALEIDEHHAVAVALMADVCQANGETQEASAMLKKQVMSFPNPSYFSMLGDLRRTARDLDGALEYYTIALSLEPNDQHALKGVKALTPWGDKQDQDTSLMISRLRDEEWQIDDEAEESSSHDEDDSDTYSDPFWQDLESEVIN